MGLKYDHIIVILCLIGVLQACQVSHLPERIDTLTIRQDKSPPQVVRVDRKKPPLTCTIHKGTANFRNKWYDFKPVAIDIRPNENLEIPLERKWGQGEMSIYMRFEKTAQKLVICPIVDALSREKVLCASIYALEEDFKQGIRRTLDVSKAIRGGQLECQYQSPAELEQTYQRQLIEKQDNKG